MGNSVTQVTFRIRYVQTKVQAIEYDGDFIHIKVTFTIVSRFYSVCPIFRHHCIQDYNGF